MLPYINSCNINDFPCLYIHPSITHPPSLYPVQLQRVLIRHNFKNHQGLNCHRRWSQHKVPLSFHPSKRDGTRNYPKTIYSFLHSKSNPLPPPNLQHYKPTRVYIPYTRYHTPLTSPIHCSGSKRRHTSDSPPNNPVWSWKKPEIESSYLPQSYSELSRRHSCVDWISMSRHDGWNNLKGWCVLQE